MSHFKPEGLLETIWWWVRYAYWTIVDAPWARRMVRLRERAEAGEDLSVGPIEAGKIKVTTNVRNIVEGFEDNEFEFEADEKHPGLHVLKRGEGSDKGPKND